jgi:hypothetical protein
MTSGRYFRGTDLELFERHIHKTEGCWNWKGALGPNGYGNWQKPGTRKMLRAHRYAFEVYKGKIPEKLVIDHLCMNRCCVNPEHLEAVTQSVNMKRAFKKRKALVTD